MSKISKCGLNVYEYTLEVDLNEDLSDICTTIEEVDACLTCEYIMKDYAYKYNHALSVATHDSKGRAKAISKLLQKAKDRYEYDDIIKEWEAVSPVYSSVMKIKDEAKSLTENILQEAKIGINRRKKIHIILHKILRDENNITEIDEDMKKFFNLLSF